MNIYISKNLLPIVFLLVISFFAKGQCPSSISIDASTREICNSAIGIYATFGGGSNFQWYKNNQAIPGATSSGMTLNPGQSLGGNYYLIANVSGCTLKSNTINIIDYTPTGVSVYPSGNNNICKGGSIQLNATSVSGYSYQWMRGSIDISGATSTVYMATESGVYNCRVTPSNRFCPVILGNIPVNVIDPVVTASPSTELCTPGQTVTLSTASNPSYTYQWRKDGNNISGATSTSYTTATPGSYSVAITYLSNNNCVAVSNPVSIVSAQGGTTTSTISGTPNYTTCSQDFGTTTLAGNIGTVVRWEYSGSSSSGPWTNWGQGGQTTTSATCCVGEGSTLWVRAVVKYGNCNEVGSTPTAYYRQPLQLTAWNDGPKCPSDPAPLVTLCTTPYPGATYHWQGPNSFIRNTTDNCIVINGLQGTFNYMVYATVNGCTTNSAITSVEVKPYLSSPVAYAQNPVCEGGELRLTAESVSGATGYSWRGPNGFTSTAQNPVIPNVGPLNAGSYFVKAINGNCSGSESMTNVVLNALPSPGSIGGNQTICAGLTPAGLSNITSGANGTYQWQSSANNNTWSDISGATSATYPPGPLSVTTYYRRNAVSVCGIVSSNVVVVTVTPLAVAGSIGNNQTICYGTSPASLTNVTSGANGTYQWQTSSNSVTWTDISGATSATYSPGLLNESTFYRRNTISVCGTASSNIVAITVTALPIAGSIGNNQTICLLTTPSPITNITPGGNGTYQWQSSSDNTNWINISGATAVTYAPGTLSATTYYRRNVVSNCGVVSSNALTITVNPLPSTSNAGLDKSICGLSTTLEGNIPSVGAGSWTQVSGPSSTNFSNSASPSSVVTVTVGGIYIYRWTISGVACPSSNDDVQVIYYVPPTISNAGTDQNVCSLSTTLAGNTPAEGTGSWSQVSGPSPTSFVNNASPASQIMVNTAGTYVYKWTISTSGCSSSADEVTVTYTIVPPATFNYGSGTGSYCNWFSGLNAPANPQPSFSGGGIAGTFSANSVNLKFINTSTGEVDLKNSAGGNYTITNTVPGSAGCPPSVSTANLTIQAPTIFTVKQDADPTKPGKVYYYIEEALNVADWKDQYTFKWIWINSKGAVTLVNDENEQWHTVSVNFPGFLAGETKFGTLIVDVTSKATGCKTRKVYGVQGKEINY